MESRDMVRAFLLLAVLPLAPFASAAPVAPTSGSVFKSTSTSVFVQWTGGGPEYRIVSKPGTTPPASDSDGTVLDVGAAMSAHVTRLRTPTPLPPEGFPAQPVTI